VLPFTGSDIWWVKATKVNAGLAESNGRLLLGIWRDSLHVTCRLTACTLGSAPGPTLGNEYGKTLPFYLKCQHQAASSGAQTADTDRQPTAQYTAPAAIDPHLLSTPRLQQ